MLDADNHRITWLRNGDTLEFTEEDDTAEEDPDDEDSDVEILQTVDEYLVLESSGPFDFVPEDGKCYDADQVGCKSAVLENLPATSQRTGNRMRSGMRIRRGGRLRSRRTTVR